MKKLSICIPTYNRADILNITLGSLVKQLKGYEDQIELIISNNCSKDNTEEIVRKYMEDYPILYHQMEENIGGNGNFNYLIEYLSNGEYSLLLGDDDIIINGSIPKILKLIQNSTYDYIYINHCYKTLEEINKIVKISNSYCKPSIEICECYDLESKEVKKWEEILNYKGLNPGINMLYIGSHLFKKEIWKENNNIISKCTLNDKPSIKEISRTNKLLYESFAMQVIILSRAMMGRRCYYCGEPLLVQGLGTQEIAVVFSQYYIRTMNSQLKHFKNCGIENEIYKDYKNIIDETILYKLSEVMNYKREQIKNNISILEYVHENIYEDGFFEKLFDTFTNNKGNHYIKMLEGVFHYELKKHISECSNNIVLWGIGDVASAILCNNDILKRKINIVVDSDILKHGKKFDLLDIEIESPNILKNKDIDFVVVSTVKYHNEIVNYIKKELMLKTTVLTVNGMFKI